MNKILFVGDSITHGTDWESKIDFADVQNIAVPGYSTEDVRAQIGEIFSINPKVISLLIGTNDFGNVELDRTGEDVGNRVLSIINLLTTTLKDSQIVVTPILPRSSAFTERILIANRLITSFAHERVIFIDSWSALADGDHLKPEYLLMDGFDGHLSDDGYRAWEMELIPKLREVISI